MRRSKDRMNERILLRGIASKYGAKNLSRMSDMELLNTVYSYTGLFWQAAIDRHYFNKPYHKPRR